MPVIDVQMLSGRSAAQKSALIVAFAKTSNRVFEVAEETVRILLIEVAPES